MMENIPENLEYQPATSLVSSRFAVHPTGTIPGRRVFQEAIVSDRLSPHYIYNGSGEFKRVDLIWITFEVSHAK